ncbi:MAG: glycoside hydrolase family 3 C-terminal domain-containing protein [Treponema sp.]|nr:glycoside hydrolase family 3 C-terminal domain-containing protein [Treponema sp.]
MKKTLDWNQYLETARQAIAEGCVLLENKNNLLPLKEGSKISIFGRIQSSYYKSGTGSGGKVNVAKVYNLVEGLEESGKVTINKKLQEIYTEWEKTHPYDEGLGWGKERWSQDEMPLTDEIVSEAAKESEIAVCIIGRTAGEDKDNSSSEGSYLLSPEELAMLKKVRKGFKSMIVLLNVGNIIDMSFVDEVKPEAVMYVWQGGMVGGLGTADVLTGKIPASGKLTDTIAYNISDYPSDKWFRGESGNDYCEDIFVGYRYFETFAKDKVRYPFGFGLTYTAFESEILSSSNDETTQKVKISVKVTNTGKSEGKEIVQVYVSAPTGKLGKAEKVLVEFQKTKLLKAGENEILDFEIPYYSFASYDDSGVTGKPNCFLLEEGKYKVFAGNSIRNTKTALSFNLGKLLVLKECEEAMAPVKKFERMHQNADGSISMEAVPTVTVSQQKRRSERIPAEIPQVKTENIKLKDVYENKASIEDFVAQLTDEDLSCIIRGEGMGSSLVTPGTASAYGGVSPRLSDTFGIPTCCCDDGPSGMRLDCGIKAFSLPNGTMLASTYNKELVTKLYSFTALEMIASKVDNLLGPGMNIHRHPLNGRNFEYFSEDPFVTGIIGTAILKGLRDNETTGTIKHFCGNNQEMNRYIHNSVVSQRALREIYLKGFEMAVVSGYADSVMTTYGLVNGIYTAGNYDLNTTILRKDWGFNGIVMTDWWANISEEGVEPDNKNFAGMIKAQNDLYMCCPDGKTNASGDNTLQALSEGKVTRAELQRSAINICNEIMKLDAMKRKMGCGTEIEIINRPVYSDDINLDDIDFIEVGRETTIDLTEQECKANANYILALDVAEPGTYSATLTGSSELGELAQLPCTLFYQGIPIASFVFNGTNGKEVTITQKICARTRFCVCRLFVAANGLKLKSIKLEYLNDQIPSFL